jgi:serine/threonine-protein kinase RsbW/stage II sporulation protein AB (anti-sigma F factor)
MTLRGHEHVNGTYPADPESVPAVRRALAELATEAGASQEQLAAVQLAVSEAMTNAVVHAYGDEPGPIYVSADLASDELWVLVADDGRGLQATTGSPGLGMGLALIADATDSFSIVTRSAGGLEVRMRFSIGDRALDGYRPQRSHADSYA